MLVKSASKTSAIICALLLCSCQNKTTIANTNHKSNPSDSSTVTSNQSNSRAPKAVDSLDYTTSVPANDHYTLDIRTIYLNDTNYIKNDWPTVQNRVVLSQMLIFKYKDSALIVKPFHVRKRTFANDKNVYLLDAILFEAASIAGTKGSFYKIRGSGGCTGCSNYTAYYSVNGELLFENYFSDQEKFVKNTGDYKIVLNRYGVPENVHNIKNVTVFPPAYNGETSLGYVL